ncbi:class I SAM-dependent methyltransferase [Massilia sp. S19_KUP03_FR1]|uniref:class I SAM-dependent methyltransferase n=1 Tax=Massilia sp. S19_KUP03_FR1 TaxID=3025503 RepID=UPI002FCDCCB8
MTQPAQTPPASASARDAGAPDLAGIKQYQQTAWASGDFAVIGVTLQIVGEALAEAADIRAHETVIDIAAGNGNATLAAARRFATVTSTDYVPALLDKGRARAAAEGLQVEFIEADAEALPFPDDSFDVALSTFGVMFAPDQERAAGEMLRVVRGGGRIALANWTPEGFVGQLFKIVGKHLPPPPGLKPALLWGTEDYMRQLFGNAASAIHAERKIFNFRYGSAAHMLQIFRDFYGPVHKAFAALSPVAARMLEQELLQMMERHNTAGPDSLVVPGEYLEVIVTRRATKVMH